MKFVYGYKTKENERCEGTIRAASKDSVYKKLKGIGIKPYTVELAPGLINKLEGFIISKVGVAIFATLATLLVVAVVFVFFESPDATALQEEDRQQIYGDPFVLQSCEVKQWGNVFSCEGCRFLMMFAQPGIELKAGVAIPSWEVMQRCLKDKIEITEGERVEYIKAKNILMYMRHELSDYINAGGDWNQYVSALVDRQQTEINIFKSVKIDLDRIAERKPEDMEVQWEAKNSILRKMGIKTLPMPE